MKHIFAFVEGDTEEEFYKSYVIPQKRQQLGGKLHCTIDVINIKGVTNGGSVVSAKVKLLKQKIEVKDLNPNYVVACCYDTDVFEVSSKPPVDWGKVCKTIRKETPNAKFVTVKAIHCIEDWFLLDLDGIFNYLRLPKPIKKPNGKNGVDSLKQLFKRANKIYTKGKKAEGLIAHLDITKIVSKIHSQIDLLLNEII